MASASVPGVHSWGNLHCLSVLGALGWSPCHGDSLWALFLCGHGAAGIAKHMRPQGWTSSVFPSLVLLNSLLLPQFLVKYQLLTRLYPLAMARG